ncbi:MAG: membrane protein insertion efficiency factor YidD [Opitutia bacterium Tous-C1TDCM]|nr:MAG: membrane protein insertion efficiency factor YidD [Opitutae bacterium Tous-C1TDCM]
MNAGSPLRRLGAAAARVPAGLLIFLIRIYQHTLSPALPVLTMGRCGCRFHPTCSHYAVDALKTHGLLAGSWLAAVRLVKCTPLHPGGPDPVPPRARPVCRTSGLAPHLAGPSRAA